MDLALELDGVHARRDLRTGELEIDVLGVSCRAREWTWGERRRLLESASFSGRLDRALLLEGLGELCFDPAPPRSLLPVFAYVLLAAQGVRRGDRPAPLERSELELVRTLGWTPSTIDGQRAGAVDRLVAALAPPAQAAPEGGTGWTRIVVGDEPVAAA